MKRHMDPVKTKGEVIFNEEIAKNIFKLQFTLDEKVEFLAGNYATIFIETSEGLKARPYTISSIPGENIEFIIKKEGLVSEVLANLKKGDKLDIRLPMGEIGFTKKYNNKKIVFVAGGTGITPVLSFIKYAKQNNTNTEFKIIYGIKFEEEIICRKELEENEHIFVLSEETKEGFEKGFISKEILEKNVSKEEIKNAIFIICGPPVMEDIVEKELKELGVKIILKEK